MGDILREIDEDLRQERLERLWKAYGKYAIGIVAIIVIGIAGMRGWQEYRIKQREAESAQYAAAEGLLSEGKDKDAAALFAALVDKAGDSYAALARFHQAGLKARENDIAAATKLYDELANDAGLTRPLRNAALVLGVMNAMNRPDADAAALQAKLEPLLAQKGPWRSSAAELSGLLALRSGDAARARERFKSVADDADAPQNVRARAAEILAMIGG